MPAPGGPTTATDRGRAPPSKYDKRSRHAEANRPRCHALRFVDADFVQDAILTWSGGACAVVFLPRRQHVEQRHRLGRKRDGDEAIFAVAEQLVDVIDVVEVGPVLAGERVRE